MKQPPAPARFVHPTRPSPSQQSAVATASLRRALPQLTVPIGAVDDDQIDWDAVTAVTGSRRDSTGQGFQGFGHPCAFCGHPTYTTRRYPDAVPRICGECLLEGRLTEGTAQ